jgi:FMN phosphatase YigB (HAD superfamily)
MKPNPDGFRQYIGRDLDRDLRALLREAGPMASAAGIRNGLARAVAFRARARDREEPLLKADFAAALASLKRKYVVASFTLLTTGLVIDVSRKNGFVWDAVISCEMIGHYKTRPEAYQTAAKWLQLPPSEILMVACHNFDLNAALACGYKTAFVKRPAEWGPAGPPDPQPNPAHHIVVDTFDELAQALSA